MRRAKPNFFSRRVLVGLVSIFSLVIMSWNSSPAQETTKSISDSLEQQRQPKYALLVGITSYKNKELTKIDGCENNVPLLSETLIADYGFRERDVKPLINKDATKDAIKAAFRSHLTENAKKAKENGKEAVIVYYFCGHGSQYKDQDGDEVDDGKDETFVAYDSRTGNVFDILDDEIDDLKTELSAFTRNTTLILESCHSGTGSRGDFDDPRYIAEEADEDKRKRPPYRRKYPLRNDADSYTEIAASHSSRTAKSESAKYCECEKPFSLMTKALVQGLKRATHTTVYKDLVREVSDAVSESSSQDPQVEGNEYAILFRGAAKRAKPYIEIDKILTDSRIRIRAGRIHGLNIGSQVSVYDSSSLTNTGKKGWLTNGIVVEVGNFKSDVQLPDSKMKKVKNTSHAVLASPVFGGGPVLLALNPGNSRSLSTGDVALREKIEQELKTRRLIENEIVKLVPSDSITKKERNESKGIIRLRKARYGDIFFRPNSEYVPAAKTYCDGNELKTKHRNKMDKDTLVYFLDEGEAGGVPMFGRVFTGSDEILVEDITKAIRNYVLQGNLRSLDNKASILSSYIEVSFRVVPGEVKYNCEQGELTVDSSDLGNPEKLAGPLTIPTGTYYQIDLKNISGEIRGKEIEFAGGEQLYVTVIWLSNNGNIEVIYPTQGDGLLADTKGKERIFNSLFEAENPVGVERYVVIVSKKYVDVGFYDSEIRTRRSPKSILERILMQSGQKVTRTARSAIDDEPDNWDVIKFDINIVKR